MAKKAKEANKVRKKNGRPTKYKPEYCKQVYKLCLLNATDAQIGDVFEVNEATINRWKKSYPEFCESLKKGKIQADAEVAKSLFHRACGYSHPDVHISNYQGDITVTNITKHYPPDTAAAFIWLKNRAGWTDKQTTEFNLSKETATLLGLIDGSSKGKLPEKKELEDG